MKWAVNGRMSAMRALRVIVICSSVERVANIKEGNREKGKKAQLTEAHLLFQLTSVSKHQLENIATWRSAASCFGHRLRSRPGRSTLPATQQRRRLHWIEKRSDLDLTTGRAQIDPTSPVIVLYYIYPVNFCLTRIRDETSTHGTDLLRTTSISAFISRLSILLHSETPNRTTWPILLHHELELYIVPIIAAAFWP